MAAYIKLHTAGGYFTHIKLGINNSFFVPYRFCKVMPVRVNNTAAAAAHLFRQFSNFVLCLQICRVSITCKIHIAVYKIAMPFNSYMLNCALLFIIIIGIWRNIQSNSFLIKRSPCQRHIAFPANHTAHWPPRRFGNREIVFVGITPYHAFRTGRF